MGANVEMIDQSFSRIHDINPKISRSHLSVKTSGGQNSNLIAYHNDDILKFTRKGIRLLQRNDQIDKATLAA